MRRFGDPRKTIVGVRSVEQAKLFRRLLPEARQLGLVPNPESIDSFARAGVEMIRLWPRWLIDKTLVPRVRKAQVKLHLNGTTGVSDEVEKLLPYGPDSLSADDPDQFRVRRHVMGKAGDVLECFREWLQKKTQVRDK